MLFLNGRNGLIAGVGAVSWEADAIGVRGLSVYVPPHPTPHPPGHRFACLFGQLQLFGTMAGERGGRRLGGASEPVPVPGQGFRRPQRGF